MARSQSRMPFFVVWGDCARRNLAVLIGVILIAGCHRHNYCDCRQLLDWDRSQIACRYESEFDEHLASSLADARRHLAEAVKLDRQNSDTCVDAYYRAALAAWPLAELVPVGAAPSDGWQVYQQSVAGLVTGGTRHGRLDPRGRLLIAHNGRYFTVPIAYHGFPLAAAEVCEVQPANAFSRNDIQRNYETPGLGAPLVILRNSCQEQPFYPAKMNLTATAVLRPAARTDLSSAQQPQAAVLDMYNPRVFDALKTNDDQLPLYRDLTASYAAFLADTPRKFTEGFIDPDDANVRARLVMVEPYQRGKIPVVFIHGLYSDPGTWIDTVNDLHAIPEVQQQFQLWFFRYPTGRGLLDSAAELRDSLQQIRQTHDPAHDDAALDRMILVGHSMGGLMAQLIASDSHDIIWRQVANQPFDAVRAPPPMRERLQRMFFFEASPTVTRIVCIGTPNRGSNLSRRLMGRAASSLVRMAAEEQAQYQKLMEINRNVFKEYLWDRWPTSVDLLEPDSPLLHGIVSLPRNPRVKRHTIIGTGGLPMAGEPSDGVVPVSSARQTGVQSETFVPARHSEIHHQLESIQQLACIFREHAAELGQ